jgi:hypothetical protein
MSATIVIAILVAIGVILIWKAGRIYPILYLFLFTFFLQYIFSTYFVYNEYRELKAQMPIKQDDLFDYAIPAMCFLFLGVFILNKDINIRNELKKIDPQKSARLGYLLVVISYTFDLLGFFGFTMFNSILSFTSYLKYIAVFCFLFSNSWSLYFLSVLIYFQLMTIVFRSGVFIDLITWGTFLYFFLCLRFQFSFLVRFFLFLATIPILITIQSVKDEYRKATWPDQREGGIELFTELVEKKNSETTGEPFEHTAGVVRTIGRLSQGWHLGLVLRRVPLRQPFADGGEMLSDISSSFVPRFLFPDKKIAHTREKFYKYTGHKLARATAMTVGILGDFYLNFGRTGSFIGLFIFGLLISRLVRHFIKRYVLSDAINIVWLPYFLSYLIRADNDFYIFFNCVVKGLLIFLVVNYFRIHYLEPKRTKKLAPL